MRYDDWTTTDYEDYVYARLRDWSGVYDAEAIADELSLELGGAAPDEWTEETFWATVKRFPLKTY